MATDLHIRLARQIIEYLEDSDAGPGVRLKESELSELFDVSRSPVRGALALLQEKGLVEKRENRGFITVANPRQIRSARSELGVTDFEALYHDIISDRVANRLNETESEADLLRRYGTTRSILTRILNRLAREGVLERSPGYGWRFLPALNTAEAHDESYAFRLLIEPAGLLQPTFRVNPADMQKSRDAHQKLLRSRRKRIPEIDLFTMNASFHEMLAEFSGNRFILQAVKQQNRLRQLVEYRGFQRMDRVHQSCREHLEILDAIDSREIEWAASLLKRHLQIASGLQLGLEEAQSDARPAA
ncbi:MAG: GntR family transcriptional regulator [Pseudomonadota bacterium]